MCPQLGQRTAAKNLPQWGQKRAFAAHQRKIRVALFIHGESPPQTLPQRTLHAAIKRNRIRIDADFPRLAAGIGTGPGKAGKMRTVIRIQYLHVISFCGQMEISIAIL